MPVSFERELHKKFEKDCGEILLYADYKEPLMPVPKKDGFGYLGVLQYRPNLEEIRCHICGKWFGRLANHTLQQHDLTAREYKIKYGLMQGTSLNSIAVSRHMSATIKALDQHIPRNKIRHGGGGAGQVTIEKRNQKGTCQAQLIAWKKQHPSIPAKKAPSYIYHAAEYIFGSWNELAKRAKVPILLGQGRRCDPLKALKGLQDFYQIHKRPPTRRDAKLGLLPYGVATYDKNFGSWIKALAKVGLDPLIYSIAQHDDHIIRAYCNDGKSLSQIAKKLHVSPNGVKYRLEKHHIPLRPSKKAIQENDKQEETNEQTGHNGD